jgi:hypothetical protein
VVGVLLIAESKPGDDLKQDYVSEIACRTARYVCYRSYGGRIKSCNLLLAAALSQAYTEQLLIFLCCGCFDVTSAATLA